MITLTRQDLDDILDTIKLISKESMLDLLPLLGNKIWEILLINTTIKHPSIRLQITPVNDRVIIKEIFSSRQSRTSVIDIRGDELVYHGEASTNAATVKIANEAIKLTIGAFINHEYKKMIS